MRKKVVTLFGGSSNGTRGGFLDEAREFGRLVAEAGWVLRTGAGSGPNVMGAAADGALAAGGLVEGVILAKFWAVRHRRLHSLKAVPTFALRKAGLLRGTSAVAIFPGGIGTLDELGDVLALKQNGFLDVPLVLLNLGGYYDPFLEWMRDAVRHGFLRRGDRSLFRVAGNAARAVRLLGRGGPSRA